MITIKLDQEKSLSLIFSVFISCLFGLVILQYDLKAVFVLGFMLFILIFFKRVDYVFYFLLASRTILDIYFSAEALGSIRITETAGMMVILLFPTYFILHRYNIFSLRINKTYGIFLFLSIIPIFYTRSLTDGFASWLKLVQGFLLMNMTILVVLAAGSESYKKRVNIICWSVFISAFLPYLFYIKSYIKGTYVVGSGDIIRYSAFGAHYNTFSYIILFSFTYCLFLYSVSNNTLKKILLPILIIMVVTIYKTYTRNVWIGLATLLIAWNLVRKKFKIIIVLLVLFILLASFSSDVQNRFKDVLVILSTKSFFDLDWHLMSGRIGVWQSYLAYFIEKSTLLEKLFGSGFDIDSKVTLINPYMEARIEGIEAHNSYLSLLMNTGIFGLFTYLVYICMLFQESVKLLKGTKDIFLRNLANVFIALLLAYLSICMATHIIWFITIQYYYSVFAGLVIAANILEDKKRCGTMVNNYANI